MIYKYFYNLSITIVGIVTSVFILTCVGSLCHIPVNQFYVLLPFIGGLYYLKKQSTENIDFLKQLLILLIITMISYYLSVLAWDNSWDGRGSHIATIVLYKNGWLPVCQNYQDFANFCHVYPPSAFWGNCYLHFAEIIGANIYKLTNLIESAKTTNFIIFFAIFMYSFAIFKGFFPNKKHIPILLAAILSFNPVSICQWFTNYIDLHIYFGFSFLVLTMLKIEHQKFTDKKDLFFFVCSSLMLAMTKFTGSMYLFIICSIYFIYLLLLKRNIKKYIKTVLVIGVLIAATGINPFYTNFRDYGHPFHPLFGKNKINIDDGNIPYGFDNKSRLETFFISTFSETLDSIDVPEIKEMRVSPQYKIPFTVNLKSYFNYFYCPNMRIGGFGYFWSGILLLSLIYLPFIRFRNINEKNIFWLIVTIILSSTFANPHCWWARYAPQLWLFPVFILFFGLLQERYSNKTSKILKLLFLYFIISTFIINCAIILYQNTKFNLRLTKLLKAPYDYIDSIKKPQDKLYLMTRPEWENMIIADETIRPHLEELYGKENIIDVPYDENKINTKEFLPIQYTYIIHFPCYFFKIAK